MSYNMNYPGFTDNQFEGRRSSNGLLLAVSLYLAFRPPCEVEVTNRTIGRALMVATHLAFNMDKYNVQKTPQVD
jgi:hypothetical protein